MPSRGDFVAFLAGGGPYPAGVTFIKGARRPAGDGSRDARGLPPQRRSGGRAQAGEPARSSRSNPVPSPGIPEGRYYVQAGHPTASTATS